ncbi:MAG: hypothetical protein IJJ99_10615 [Oscillospiraceae bacterium]|nr:hypothetical protein [Oscillospiraceae bacterium]
MKKTYQKPELFYEDFTLMDSIAAVKCGEGTGQALLLQADIFTCAAHDFDLDWIILMSYSVGCQEIIDDVVAAGSGTQIS